MTTLTLNADGTRYVAHACTTDGGLLLVAETNVTHFAITVPSDVTESVYYIEDKIAGARRGLSSVDISNAARAIIEAAKRETGSN